MSTRVPDPPPELRAAAAAAIAALRRVAKEFDRDARGLATVASWIERAAAGDSFDLAQLERLDVVGHVLRLESWLKIRLDASLATGRLLTAVLAATREGTADVIRWARPAIAAAEATDEGLELAIAEVRRKRQRQEIAAPSDVDEGLQLTLAELRRRGGS